MGIFDKARDAADSLKDNADELKEAATGEGSLSDKAKGVANVAKDSLTSERDESSEPGPGDAEMRADRDRDDDQR